MMKKTILLTTLVFCMANISAQSTGKMCLTNDFAIVEQEGQDSEYRTMQQELVSNKKTWPLGSKIKVSFMDRPSSKVLSKIKKYAQEWERYANIKFEFVGYAKFGHIRISLKQGIGNWSLIGTDALKKLPSVPTMNFDGFKDSTNEGTFRRVVLHEFGHALGLNHEHKSPSQDICWDWPKVIQTYKKSLNWDEDRTRRNLERLSNEDVGNYTSFDPKSIMIYSIDKNLTTCGFEVKGTSFLSYHDKQGIANLYPKTVSRNLKDNILKTYKWTSGWNNVETFEAGNKTYLFLLKSKTGNTKIFELGSNGTVGSKVFDKKWTAGWTTARIFRIRIQNYLFLLKKNTGDVKVFKLNSNGTVGSKVFDKKWSTGWTDAQFYRTGNQHRLFLLKESTGDVHINIVNNNGTIGAKTFDKKWTSGWSLAKTFTTNYQPHLFLMKASTGDVHVHKLNSNGTVGSKVYDKKWSSGWTSVNTYAVNGQQYLMLLNSKNGRAVRWYITSGGTIGEAIANEKLHTGWTSNESFRLANKNFMILLKEKDGLVKTFALK